MQRQRIVLPTRQSRQSISPPAVDAPIDMSPATKKRKYKKEQNTKVQAFEELLSIRAKNGGKQRRGDIQSIVSAYHRDGYKYVTRRCLEWMHSKVKSGKSIYPVDRVNVAAVGGSATLVEADLSDLTNPTEDVMVVVNKGGRTKGSTIEAAKGYIARRSAAITDVAIQYNELKSNTDKLEAGVMNAIIKEAEEKYDIRNGEIKLGTIRSRYYNKNIEGIAHHKVSPIAEIEPNIVNWCLELARMGCPLKKNIVINLARELISGTQYEDDLFAYKRKRRLVDESDNVSSLGERWYQGFMKRHEKYIVREKSKIKDKVRTSWTTYNHFEDMYEAAYEAMAKCGVAVKLEHEVMLNRKGEEVYDVKEMFGRPTKYKLVKPEDCIFVDETGCNTNMKVDPQIGGSQFVMPANGSGSAPVGLFTDLHFTFLCFTAATGNAVMCAIILKSDRDERDLPLSWIYGMNETINTIPGDNEYELLKNNFGSGKSMAGGPECMVKGIPVPCFIGASPSSSITSELLGNMLEFMDSKCLFDRSNGSYPFLLLDGHGSRFQLPFLHYINQEVSKWQVNIGVPYGTHLWQVADSAELNSSFKTALAKAKLQYIAENKDGIKDRWYPSDIIPLVNMAFPLSFGRSDLAKRAVEDRGWGPLNYILLDHPEIRHTKPNEIECDLECPSILSDNILFEKLNFDGGITNRLATICIEKRLMDHAKNEKYLQGKQEEIANKENREMLKEWLQVKRNWRSGKFAARKQYNLTQPEILEAAQERYDEQINKQIESSDKSASNKQRKEERFNLAFTKYSKSVPLTVDDMKAMMSHVKDDILDSPFKSKKEGIMKQWENRKARLDKYKVNHSLCVEMNENENFSELGLLAEAIVFSTSAVENNSLVAEDSAASAVENSNHEL